MSYLCVMSSAEREGSTEQKCLARRLTGPRWGLPCRGETRCRTDRGDFTLADELPAWLPTSRDRIITVQTGRGALLQPHWQKDWRRAHQPRCILLSGPRQWIPRGHLEQEQHPLAPSLWQSCQPLAGSAVSRLHPILHRWQPNTAHAGPVLQEAHIAFVHPQCLATQGFTQRIIECPEL